jgi:NADH-quinone oxidoreductase subunit C
MRPLDDLVDNLRLALGEHLRDCRVAFGEVTVTVLAADLPAVARLLHNEPRLAFAQLIDIAGLDYSTYGQADWQTTAASSEGFSRASAPGTVQETAANAPLRFAAVYHLLSIAHNSRLRIRVFAPGEPPCLPSVVEIWPAANWFEREAFDLFGILFDGHPDLRRILTDYGFVGHPFRKDFPLEGHVEVRYDPEQRRVVYQPVSIEPRVLVPRVIRTDTPFIQAHGRDGTHA